MNQTSHSNRVSRVAQQLDSLGIDAMLVTDEVNVRYLSGFKGDSTVMLVRSSASTLLSDGRYETQLAQQCPGIATRIRPPSVLMPDLIAQTIADLSLRRVGIESSAMTVAMLRTLATKCEAVQLVETTGVVETGRMVKDESEIATTRQAVAVAQQAFLSVRPMLTPRSTELQIAYQLEANMRALGAEGCSFSPIVAAGPAGALPHYHPGDVAIGEATSLLVDWGAKYHGYASDLTRTLHRPNVSDDFRRAYDAVLEAQLAAIDAIRPGAACNDIDAAAREVLARHGMADAFKHGLGHGTGLQIHESPRMSSICTEKLAPGMIVTVEPGVYFADAFGIRIEDDVLVTAGGCEVLSDLPKGLDECRLLM